MATSPSYPAPQASRGRSPWPWVIGFGCGVPVLLIGGCMLYVGNVIRTRVPELVRSSHLGKATQQISQVATAFTTNSAGKEIAIKPGTVKFHHESDGLHIQGTIVNRTSARIPYLQVKVGGEDNTGARLAEGYAVTTDLAPHEAWGFRITIHERDAVKPGPLHISTTPIPVGND